MKINIWEDPGTNKYYFAIEHEDTLLSAVMAEFYGKPEAIALIIKAISKGSELGEKGDE